VVGSNHGILNYWYRDKKKKGKNGWYIAKMFDAKIWRKQNSREAKWICTQCISELLGI